MEQFVGGEAEDGAIDAVDAFGAVVLEAGIDQFVEGGEIFGDGGEAGGDFGAEVGDGGVGFADFGEFGEQGGGGVEGLFEAFGVAGEVGGEGDGVLAEGAEGGEVGAGVVEAGRGGAAFLVEDAQFGEEALEAVGVLVAVEFALEDVEVLLDFGFRVEEIVDGGEGAFIAVGKIETGEAEDEVAIGGEELGAALLEVGDGLGAGQGESVAERFEQELEGGRLEGVGQERLGGIGRVEELDHRFADLPAARHWWGACAGCRSGRSR